MYFLRCVCFFVIIGILSFFAGRLMARHSFKYDAFPFRSLPFEKDGQLYKRLGIAAWQSHVPDMSRIFKKLMPPKKMEGRPDRARLLLMIQETCVAELIHVLLGFAGIAVLWIWPGAGGIIIWLVYCLGNLPYILIQRYNRPRLVRLLRRCRTGEEREI